jgi:hypothetical protein
VKAVSIGGNRGSIRPESDVEAEPCLVETNGVNGKRSCEVASNGIGCAVTAYTHLELSGRRER